MSQFYTQAASNRLLSAITPGSIQLRDNMAFAFFSRYLVQKILSVFKWSTPDTWDTEYLQCVLYRDGYIIVTDTPEFGVIPQEGTLGGRTNANYWYNYFTGTPPGPGPDPPGPVINPVPVWLLIRNKKM